MVALTPADQTTAPPTSTTNSARVIPGLSGSSQLHLSTSSAKRSRKKKVASVIKSEELPQSSPAINDAPLSRALDIHHEADKPNGISVSPLNNNLPATVSPVQQVQKRIRAATKKLQRIAGYESSSVPLNDDQKRAIASKPALEATVKELQDLLKILEDDEKLDEARIQAIREEEEAKVQSRIESVISVEQTKAETKLTLLLQFLHLYSLFSGSSRSSNSFVPENFPPVVQNATSQDFAAVNALFFQLSNGPLVGGEGDAFERIEQFTRGSESEVIPGVTFARIKEMIIQLTAPPAELLSSNHSQNGQTASSVFRANESAAMTQTDAPSHLMFLQQSDVLSPSVVIENAPEVRSLNPPSLPPPSQSKSDKAPTIDHVTRNKQLLEIAEVLDPSQPHSDLSDWTQEASGQSPAALSPVPVTTKEWSSSKPHLSLEEAEVVSRTIDWAEEVQDVESKNVTSGEDFTRPPPPSAGASSAAQIEAPGSAPPPHQFNPAGRGYRGRGGGYRGGPPGGRGAGHQGGRGWHRGGGGGNGPGGFRGRGGSSHDMNGGGTWRHGAAGSPMDGGQGGYRPRADYANSRYGQRGGPRNTVNSGPEQYTSQPEVVNGTWN